MFVNLIVDISAVIIVNNYYMFSFSQQTSIYSEFVETCKNKDSKIKHKCNNYNNNKYGYHILSCRNRKCDEHFK